LSLAEQGLVLFSTVPLPDPQPANLIENVSTPVIAQQNPPETDPITEALPEVLREEFLSNELWRWGALFVAVFLGYLIGKIVSFAVLKAAERLTRQGRMVMASVAEAVGRTVTLAGIVLGLSVGMRFLLLPEDVAETVSTSMHVLGTFVIGLLAWRLVEVCTTSFKKYASKTDTKLDDALVPILRTSLRVTVIVFAGVHLIQVVSGKEITSILAGLGIGGLAVALAAQDSLKNIFGSIVIFLDKPFQIGERVVVDGFDGAVEEVGLRSTRIRTLTGHLVTIPPGALATKNIETIGRRPHIRRLLNVTVTYDTPPEKVQRAVDIILGLLLTAPGEGGRPEKGDVNHPDFPPRAYFNDFNDTSLNIIVLYWYHPAAYWDYMAHAQWFNTELLRRFNDEGIDFAFPTQTLYVAGGPEAAARHRPPASRSFREWQTRQ
jgi:MscS family membrane protein